MRITATVSMIYDSDVMDMDDLTKEEFLERVLHYTIEDFNGGVQFDEHSIEITQS